MSRGLILCLFYLSGASALIYELVWTQLFGLVFGATATATAAVLAAYMFGLCLGAAVISRYVDRIRRPILGYALLEFGIAATALLVLPALDIARWAHTTVSQRMALEGGASALFYLVFAFAILVAPTALMGATFPLLVRFWIHRRDEVSRGVASLYVINTLGAATGILLTGFFLIPRFGLGLSVLAAVAINGVVALLAFVGVARQNRQQRDRPLTVANEAEARAETETGTGTEETEQDAAPTDRLWAPVMYALVCGSGLVGMGYEVYWTRILVHPLGGSLYAFSTMLASFLIGISLGALATTARSWHRRSAWAGFGCAQLGIAACGFLTLRAFDAGLLDRAVPERGLSMLAVGLVGLTLVPGALLLGASFPLAVRAVSRRASQAAAASGRVYAWNTLGTIAGALLCGFWLLPRFQFSGTAAILIAISLALSSVSFLVAGASWRKGALIAALGGIILIIAPPKTPWQLLIRGGSSQRFNADQVSLLGVGRSATVMLVDNGLEHRLFSDGLPESSIQGPGGRPARFAVAYWLALLPASVRPEAERALVIGFGAGMTAEALPTGIQEVDVAEIEPEIIHANRALAQWRRSDPLRNPRLHLILNDARNALATRQDRYDLVISQPSHPWTLGAASLFTTEFYSLVASRLNPRGVFLQWIALPFVDADLLRAQIATMRRQFRYVEVMRPPPTGAVLLIGSAAPIDFQHQIEVSWPSYQRLWKAIGVSSVASLANSRWLDDEGSKAFSAGAEISTDYRNLMLIRSPQLLGQGGSATGKAMVPFDTIREQQAAREDLFPLRHMLENRHWDRARAALAGIEHPQLRATAEALWGLAQGNRGRAVAKLENLVQTQDAAKASTSPASWVARREALAALLRVDSGRTQGVSPARAELLRPFPALETTYRAWQRSRLDDRAGLQQLDGELAAIDTEHPIFPMALGLRILWRHQSGEGALAQQALVLLESQMSVSPGLQPLILRAQLAWIANDLDRLFDSLFEISFLEIDRRPGSPKTDIPPTLRTLLRKVAADTSLQQDPRWEVLHRQITKKERARETS